MAKKSITISSDAQGYDTAAGVAIVSRQAAVQQQWGFLSCHSFLSLGS